MVYLQIGVVVCAVLVTSGIVEATSTASIVGSLSVQSTTFSNIFGAAIVTERFTTSGTSSGLQSVAAVGFRNAATEDLFLPSTPLRANTGLGELSIAVLTQRLINAQLLPQLDSSIPTRLFPRGIQLLNPAFPGVPLTLRMLLTHTSSLVDNGALFTSPTSSSPGVSQVSLSAYAVTYFLTAGSSSSLTAATDIWSVLQPGLVTSFQYARANIVLLSYIIEQLVVENPTLVSGTQLTVGAYMQESVFATLAMTDTFFLLPDGSLPSTSTNMMIFTNRVAVETTASGIAASSVPLYAGYPADIMLRTSATDTMKLIRALFLDTSSAFYTIGQQLIAGLVSVTDTSRPGVSMQGFGIVGFDAVAMCSAGSSTLYLPAGCSTQSSTLYGIMGIGSNTAVVAMCTSDTDSATTGTTCTASTFLYHPTSTMTLASTAFPAAVAAFNDQFIDSSVTDGATIRPSDQKTEPIFGFFVFLGVMGASVAVLYLAYVGEYILRPVPLLGPQANHAYPTLNEHMDRTNHIIRNQQSPAPSRWSR